MGPYATGPNLHRHRDTLTPKPTAQEFAHFVPIAIYVLQILNYCFQHTCSRVDILVIIDTYSELYVLYVFTLFQGPDTASVVIGFVLAASYSHHTLFDMSSPFLCLNLKKQFRKK